jgi:hypothetical protein
MAKSLLDMLKDLIFDDGERAAFTENPQHYMTTNGITEATGHDVAEAMLLVCDTLPPDVALRYGAYTGGSTNVANTGANVRGGTAVVQVPPPPSPAPLPGETDFEAAVRQISYVTNVANNTYTDDRDLTQIDDRDTSVDSSINQRITALGDVNQSFDNDTAVASGDGAVAAGRDIDVGNLNTGTNSGVMARDIDDSAVNTGTFTGVQAGDDVGNAVVGDGNTSLQANDSNLTGVSTAFGDGDALTAGGDLVNNVDGSAVATGLGQAANVDDGAVSFGSGDANNADVTGVGGGFGDGDSSVTLQQGDGNVGITDQSELVDQSVTDQSIDATLTDQSYTDQSVDASVNTAVDASYEDNESYVDASTTDASTEQTVTGDGNETWDA